MPPTLKPDTITFKNAPAEIATALRIRAAMTKETQRDILARILCKELRDLLPDGYKYSPGPGRGRQPSKG